MTSSLDSLCELSLMVSTSTCYTSWEDLGSLSHALSELCDIFIVDSLCSVYAEHANLLAGLFSGSLVLEIIFAYPGIGRLMYEAVLQQDINLVLANSMFISALVLIGMVISDILLAFVDPRIRYGKE